MNTEALLKKYCKYVYIAGAGNYWYEDLYPETLPYRVYTYISFAVYTIMVLLENLAAMFGSFPDVEKNSAVMFAAIHDIVLYKMYVMLFNKMAIRRLNREMAAIGADREERSVMERQKYRLKWGMIVYVVSVYLSLSAYGVESFRRMYQEDLPFYSVVTYLPRYDDHSIIAKIFRVFFYITWLYMMLPMMSADCFPITHLIVLNYKFVTLRHHFEDMRRVFEKDFLSDKESALRKLKESCLEGILIHQKLLKLADEITRVFGMIMSLQVCESSAVAVLLLLRLALAPHMNLTNAFMTYTFVTSLFILLALNLWNAGEITHQASLLSNSIFYCGWHLSPLKKDKHKDEQHLRRLVLLACAEAQRPLVLKAFGVQDLSYATFVAVARTTYSIFAVFYQRNG